MVNPAPVAGGHAVRRVASWLATKAYEELTVAAGVSGDPDLAFQALVMNPFIPSVRVAREVWNEMSEAHRAYLPKFFR